MAAVLHFIQSGDRGGAQRHVEDLVRHRTRETAGVVVGGEGRLTERLAALGVPVFVWPELRRSPSVVLAPRLAERLVEVIRQTRAEVLHAHGIVALAALSSTPVARPLVYTSHGVLWQDPAAGLVYRLGARLLVRHALGRLAAVVAVARAEEEALRRLGCPVSRLHYIPNGVPVPADPAPSTGHRIGTVCRLVPGKGLERLLEVLADLPDVELWCAGDGPLRPLLLRQAKRLRVSGRLRWLGWVDDLSVVYRAISVYVSLSAKEGLPYAVLDAMAFGLPVVASDIPAHRELLAEGRVGRLVDPRRREEVAGAIAQLLSRRECRQELGLAARARVARDFSLEAMVRRHEALYRQLTDKGGSPLTVL